MRALVRMVLALTLTVGIAATAAAQDTRRQAEPELAPDVNYDFEDDRVTGDGVAPVGTLVPGRIRPRRTSLVRPRVHFVLELTKSIERI